MIEPTHARERLRIARAALDACLLPRDARRALERAAATPLPILCLDCHGPCFARLAAAIHDLSGRDRLVSIDLRTAPEAMLAGLIRAGTAPRATLAIDGIERLDREAQAALVRTAFASEVGTE